MRLYGQRSGCHFPGCTNRAMENVPHMLLCAGCEARLPQDVRARYRRAMPRQTWEKPRWSVWSDKTWDEYLAARAEMLRTCAAIALADREAAAARSPA